MAALIIADDLVRTSLVQHRQSRHLLLDRAYAGQERGGIFRCRSISLDQRDLGVVLASGKPGRLPGERAIGRDTDAGFDLGHENPRNMMVWQLSKSARR